MSHDDTTAAFAIVTCIASAVQAILVLTLVIWQRRRTARAAQRESDAAAQQSSSSVSLNHDGRDHGDEDRSSDRSYPGIGSREQVQLVALLPIYVAIMWIIVIAGMITASWRLINYFGSGWTDLLLTRCIEWTIYHFACEGVVFVLLQPGGGVAALRRALILSLLWAVFTFTFLYVLTITAEEEIPDLFSFSAPVRAGYDSIAAAGYLIIAITPLAWFVRRPSVILYSRVMAVFTIIRIALEVSASFTDGIDAIDYIRAAWECVGALMMPPLLLRTLLTDSQYWQGLALGPSPSHGVSLKTPLIPMAIPGLKAGTAGALALDLDALISAKVPILNYAFLNLGDAKKGLTLLGVGGTARVFQATYRGQPCAAKLVYLPELTPADIRRFVHEANKLYAFKGCPNVVQLIGVAVWPPALALVMELCPYGSLYDVLHAPRPQSSSSSRDRTTSRDRSTSASLAAARHSQHNTSKSLTRDQPLSSATAAAVAGVSRSVSFTVSTNGRSHDGSGNERRDSEQSDDARNRRDSHDEQRENSTDSSSSSANHSVPPIELTWRTRLLLAWQCAKGVAALHSHHMPLVHLDLKSTNFLVGLPVGRTADLCSFEAKVADFQLSLTRAELAIVTEVPQTLNWTAPELLPESKGGTGPRTSAAPLLPSVPSSSSSLHIGLKQPHSASFNSGHARVASPPSISSVSRNKSRTPLGSPHGSGPLISPTGRTVSSSLLSLKTDCWALGMVLYEIGTGQVPFHHSRQPELGQRGLARADTISDISNNNYRPLIPADIDRRYASLMRDLWATSPADRPTAQQAADRLFRMLRTDFGVDASYGSEHAMMLDDGSMDDDDGRGGHGHGHGVMPVVDGSFIIVDHNNTTTRNGTTSEQSASNEPLLPAIVPVQSAFKHSSRASASTVAPPDPSLPSPQPSSSATSTEDQSSGAAIINDSSS